MRDLRTQVCSRSVSVSAAAASMRPRVTRDARSIRLSCAQTRHHQVRIDGKFRGFLALARQAMAAKLEPSTVGHDPIEVVAGGVKGFEPDVWQSPSERIETRSAEIGNFAFFGGERAARDLTLLSAC